MVKPFPSKTHIGNHMLHPETLMLNYGYDPQLSEGAVKPPVFLTSTFVARAICEYTKDMLVGPFHLKTAVIMSEDAAWTKPFDAGYLECMPRGAGL